LTAFRSLLNNSLTAEAHRSIALYITYAVHKPKDKTNALRHTKTVTKAVSAFATISRRSTVPISSDIHENPSLPSVKALSKSEVGIKMLETYAELLCQRDTSNIKKFARTVTNKVLYFFLGFIFSFQLLTRISG
jgi:beige protein homolog 1